MPTNLTKQYNDVLDLLFPSHHQNISSIKNVFNRDFTTNLPILFKNINVEPAPNNGTDKVELLFRHLTTKIIDEKTRKREFESERAIRLHWIRFHIEGKCKDEVICFEVENEHRIYILNKTERYVIVFEPKKTSYYLLTAYKLEPSSYKKIMNKLEKRGRSI